MPRSACVLLLCLVLAGCGGDSDSAQPLLVFGVAPDYDEPAEEIVAVRRDGSGLQTLTREVPGIAHLPAPSPDGRHIAFNVAETVRGADSWLHVMAADGTRPRQLVPKKAGYSYVEGWSPDGKRVLYSDFSGALWTVGVDGSGRRRVMTKGAGGAGGEPVWSPDGSAIAYLTGTESVAPVLHLYDIRNGRSRVLVRGALLPRWTPDSTRLLFKRIFRGKRSGFYVVDRDGGTPRLLKRIGAEDDPWLGGVSPDGEWVLVAYLPGISRISLEDGKRQKLTNGVGDSAPAWSPDGEQIAFQRGGNIWVMDADGGNERVVARAPRARIFTSPHWLP
jgi:Tol biopolymer transport system component